MPHYRLPAGTDAAEMALFDVDALSTQRPDYEAIQQIANTNRLVRISTSGDGGYLLHLFVNEEMPAQLKQYCLDENQQEGRFLTATGNIAFGGVESAFQGFKPNAYIRSDASISAGEYAYLARWVEIPDEVYKVAVDKAITDQERKKLGLPFKVTIATLMLLFISAATQFFVLVPLFAAIGYFAVKKIKRSPAYQSALERKKAAELDFPDIVMELRSI